MRASLVLCCLLAGCLAVQPAEDSPALVSDNYVDEVSPGDWVRYAWDSNGQPMSFDFAGNHYLTRWITDEGTQEHLWPGAGMWDINPDVGDLVEVVIGFQSTLDYSTVTISNGTQQMTLRTSEWPSNETGQGHDYGFLWSDGTFIFHSENMAAGGDRAGTGGDNDVGFVSWTATWTTPSNAYTATHTHHRESIQVQGASYQAGTETVLDGTGPDAWPEPFHYGVQANQQMRHEWAATHVGFITGGVPVVAPEPADGANFYLAFAWFNGLDAPKGPVTTW